MISPKDLPYAAPAGHPAPWSEDDAGNGHVHLRDANGILVAHVYVFDTTSAALYKRKLAGINLQREPAD